MTFQSGNYRSILKPDSAPIAPLTKMPQKPIRSGPLASPSPIGSRHLGES